MKSIQAPKVLGGGRFQKGKDPEQGKTVSMVTVGAGSCPIRVSSWSHFLKLEEAPELPRQRENLVRNKKYFHGVVQALSLGPLGSQQQQVT